MEAAVIALVSVIVGLVTWIAMSRIRRKSQLKLADTQSAEAVTDADTHIRAALATVRTELGLVRADLTVTHAELKNVRSDIRHALESNERLTMEVGRLIALMDRRL